MQIDSIPKSLHDEVVGWALDYYRTYLGKRLDTARGELDARNVAILLAVVDRALVDHNKRLARPRIHNKTVDALTEQLAQTL